MYPQYRIPGIGGTYHTPRQKMIITSLPPVGGTNSARFFGTFRVSKSFKTGTSYRTSPQTAPHIKNSLVSSENEGVETVKKGLCPFLTKGLQSAARTICTHLAYKSHTCSLIGIFCQVQEVNCPEGARETTLGCAPTENDQNPFAACGRQTLRGFFDTLNSLVSSENEGVFA